MGDEWRNNCLKLIDEVPHEVYVLLIVIFCAGAIMAMGLKGLKDGWKYMIVLMLLEYVFLLYASTVIYRATMRELKYNFTPFWSYVEIVNGDKTGLLSENIMNILAFVPVGFLLGVAISQGKEYDNRMKMGWMIAFLIGAGLSVGIESLQFFFMKGFAEMDDVMHNIIGCLVGYGIICSLKTSRRISST